MADVGGPVLVPGAAGEVAPLVGPSWEPLAIRSAAVAAAVDALLDAARVDADLRRTLLVHPRSPTGTGLTPSMTVAIEVLRPGESAMAPRRSSSALTVQLRGETDVVADGHHRRVGPRDVMSIPPFCVQSCTAVGPEPSVRLVYSNAALLEHLGAHHVEALATLSSDGAIEPLRPVEPLAGARSDDHAVRNDGRVERLGADAWRLEYERVIDPPWVPLRSWHWRWTDIVEELDRMGTLDERYHGRRVCVLHDPTTGRTNGTTSTLFASMAIRPAGIVDRTHRHSAAAVNLFLQGTGWSTVDGQRIEWGPGDLVFIAPAWAVHHHASDDDAVYQLAVQDNPLHLAMGSLVWQEDLHDPPRLLGAEPGFTTNRSQLEPTP